MLEVKELKKVYRPKSGAEVWALNGVSLKLADKGLVFLLGKSGSGKSTLLNLMGGLDSYSSGDIVIKGKSSKSFNQSDFDSYRNTYIGFIFQEFNILEDYTVGKNIGLALELQHKKSDDAAIDEILAQVDLEGYKNRKPNELSGGQKQRVAIARALIKNPEIIMGDEPTGSLDSKTGKQVFDTLKKLSKDKLVVVVSHDRENAEFYGDRVIELADGVVISDRIRSGETGELVSQPIDYIAPDLVKIKGGYQLSDEDIQKLNNLLAKTRGDVFITADEGLNTHIKTTKNITSKSAGGGFVPITEQNYSVKQYKPSDFKLVRSKLPYKDSLKMGASGLKLKKVRLAFTIILSFFAFFLFGFSNTASNIQSQQTQMRTFSTQGGKGILVSSQSGQQSFGGGIYWDRHNVPGITEKQQTKLAELAGKPLLKLVEASNDWGGTMSFSLSIGNNIRDKQSISGVYYSTNIERFVEVPSEDSLGLTKANGAPLSKLPSSFDEIAITDYIADSFLDFGFVEYVYDEASHNYKETKYEISSYGDLIGKFLGSTNQRYKITGVYNTGFDMSDFSKYKTMVDGLGAMTATSFSSMVFGMGFVKEGFTDNWIASQGSGSSNVVDCADTSLVLKHTQYAESTNEFNFYSAASVDTVSNLSSVHWLGGKTASTLTENDIIVNINRCGIWYNPEEGNTASKAIEQFFEEWESEGTLTLKGKESTVNIAGIYDPNKNMDQDFYGDFFVHNSIYKELYAEQQAELAESRPIRIDEYGLGNFGDSNRLFTYHANQAYRFNRNSKYFYEGNFHFKSGFNSDKLANNQIIISYDFFNDYSNYDYDNRLEFDETKVLFNSLSSYTCSLGRIGWEKNGLILDSIMRGDLEIVGITRDHSIYVSDDLYNELDSLKSGVNSVIVPLTGDFSVDKEVFEYIFSQEIFEGRYGSRLVALNTLTPLMELLEDMLPVLRTVFLYVSLAFSLFAALLLMNFIGVSINHKKKDIGVLRAIGARSKDVFMIFFFESLIIGAINFILSVAAVVILSIVLNSLMGVVIFVPGVLQIGLMFVLCFAIVLLATFLPVRKIARKKPIDAINNR